MTLKNQHTVFLFLTATLNLLSNIIQVEPEALRWKAPCPRSQRAGKQWTEKLRSPCLQGSGRRLLFYSLAEFLQGL